ncbi:MAG: hypothetical protein INR69_03055 [Mucilaginibacter polytrichastri]|nr:hypothetical protein [Mucilaginibacter polytrichastri]
MRRVLIFFAFFTLFISVPPLLMEAQVIPDLRIPKFNVLFGFYTVLTLAVIISVLYVRRRGSAENSARTFLAATVLKLLLCMGIALFYILKFDADRSLFVLNFFYLYFLNTAFEMYALIRNLRHQNF